MNFRLICMIAVIVVLPATASAQSRTEIGEVVTGYAFYNRVGATPAEHDSDLTSCFAIVPVGRPRVTNPSGTGIGDSLVMTWVWGGAVQGLFAVSGENCMIARGWRVYRLSDAEGAATYQLSGTEFRERVAPWLGSATPPGTYYRGFNNEAAHPARYSTASRPGAPSPRHLSVRFALEGGAQVGIPGPVTPIRTDYDMRQPERTTTVHRPGSGNAVVVLMVRGGSRGISFGRVSDGQHAGGRPIVFGMTGSSRGRWHVVEVPAGRWRINHTGVVNHCLGSPSFEVGEGEVVYAGDFDLAGANIGPQLDMTFATSALEGPGLEVMRTAEYENGSTVACVVGVVPYPLEFEGFPFASGYRSGSMAPGRVSE
ncbi:hypothetical protein [Brevundimonas aveniformis]|uniref:hypothetical protein n=1 Tax=Brevundimonas aveniformis TaxID=370977 RepID=UPI00048C83E1|nr:hypothetical protein [Brevundimonas aveniformis]